MTPDETLANVKAELVRRALSPDTIRVVLCAGRALLTAVATPAIEVGREDVREHLAAAERRGVARSTQRAALTRLRIFFKALVVGGEVERDPTEGLSIRSGRAARQRVVSSGDVGKLMAAALVVKPIGHFKAEVVEALALRDRACLELLYGVGIRRSEAGAVRVLDLRLGEGSIIVRRAKRGESRALPLPRPAVEHLQRYLVEGRPVLAKQWKGGAEDFFLLSWSGAPLLGTGVWQVVSRIARRAGVKIAPHGVRRSLATHLLREGVNVEAVRQVLGHESLSSTAIYTLVDQADLRRAVSVLDFVAE